MKVTIHRALSELKIIDDRIQKSISTLEPVGLMQKGKKVNNQYDQDEFENKAKSKYQSAVDLIKRKNEIKTKIVDSNANTKVKIGDEIMSVADAITKKTTIDFRKMLLERLKNVRNQAQSRANTENERIKEVALNNAQIMLGKEGGDVKPNDKDVENIMNPFIERNEIQIVDPLGVEDLIEKLEREIEDFETEVDAVLSESNAITFIELED